MLIHALIPALASIVFVDMAIVSLFLYCFLSQSQILSGKVQASSAVCLIEYSTVSFFFGGGVAVSSDRHRSRIRLARGIKDNLLEIYVRENAQPHQTT